MTMQTLPKPSRWLVLALAGCLAVGCGSHADQKLPDGTTHIMKVSTLYAAYRRANNNKAPASADELKAWAGKLPKQQLEQMGIDDLDKALISPRDNEPYQLAPPMTKGPAARMGIQGVVAYEKVGVNGKRLMVSGMGSATEVTDEQLKEILAGS
jgi:hypothetical protein